MKLKQNENGETVIVSTTTEETKLSADVLISRIALLADEINSLQITLQAVQEFESNTNIEQDMVISDVIEKPIIDTAMLESIVNIEPVIVEEIIIVEEPIKSEIEKVITNPFTEEKLNTEERIA